MGSFFNKLGSEALRIIPTIFLKTVPVQRVVQDVRSHSSVVIQLGEDACSSDNERVLCQTVATAQVSHRIVCLAALHFVTQSAHCLTSHRPALYPTISSTRCYYNISRCRHPSSPYSACMSSYDRILTAQATFQYGHHQSWSSSATANVQGHRSSRL